MSTLPRKTLVAVLVAGPALAQDTPVTYSVDWHGVLKGTMSPMGVEITEGDVLRPVGGVPDFEADTPEIVFTGGLLGLVRYTVCKGSGPGDACGVELDALSYGKDPRVPSAGVPYRVYFSTDEYAQGEPLPPPSVASEAQVGDVCADVFVTRDLPPFPVPPVFPAQHRGLLDGDGLPSMNGSLYRGLGLTEPNLPGTGLPNNPFDPGDNVDAFDVGAVADPDTESIWFSLDAAFFDQLAGRNNSGTAAFQGVDPGDVLRRLPNGTTVVYALAVELGLDRNGPPGSDDLDALVLWENGVDGFQPPSALFDWEDPDPGAGTDMLLFSVRRGSALIGKPDSALGIPITEGDLLMPPLAAGNGNPAIVVAAEALGLFTNRGGLGSDDLNGADIGIEPFNDCNDNGIEDAYDIGSGDSRDDNENGIPDECEDEASRFCFCPGGGSCGTNPDAGAGCANSTGVGADLSYAGTTSFFTDDLVLTTTLMPASTFGITIMGDAVTSAFLADGIRCAGGALFRYPAQSSGAGGTFALGPGIVAQSELFVNPAGHITSGSTWHFQSWYRDTMGSPCGGKSNLSNGVSVTFTP